MESWNIENVNPCFWKGELEKDWKEFNWALSMVSWKLKLLSWLASEKTKLVCNLPVPLNRHFKGKDCSLHYALFIINPTLQHITKNTICTHLDWMLTANINLSLQIASLFPKETCKCIHQRNTSPKFATHIGTWDRCPPPSDSSCAHRRNITNIKCTLMALQISGLKGSPEI